MPFLNSLEPSPTSSGDIPAYKAMPSREISGADSTGLSSCRPRVDLGSSATAVAADVLALRSLTSRLRLLEDRTASKSAFPTEVKLNLPRLLPLLRLLGTSGDSFGGSAVEDDCCGICDAARGVLDTKSSGISSILGRREFEKERMLEAEDEVGWLTPVEESENIL